MLIRLFFSLCTYLHLETPRMLPLSVQPRLDAPACLLKDAWGHCYPREIQLCSGQLLKGQGLRVCIAPGGRVHCTRGKERGGQTL